MDRSIRIAAAVALASLALAACGGSGTGAADAAGNSDRVKQEDVLAGDATGKVDAAAPEELQAGDVGRKSDMVAQEDVQAGDAAGEVYVPDHPCPGVKFDGPCLTEYYTGWEAKPWLVETYVYNECDEVSVYTLEYLDEASAGVSYAQYSHYYMECTLIQSETDLEIDGAIDLTSDYYYDDDGLLVIAETVDASGDAVKTIHYTYDGNGNPLLVDQDDGADGTVDLIWTYEYDENGNRVSWAVDDDANGSIDNLWLFTYDDEAKLVQTQVFTGQNLVYIVDYSYDENGNLAKATTSDPAGKPGLYREYEYDDAGNLRERNLDGAYALFGDEGTVLYHYDCWPCPEGGTR